MGGSKGGSRYLVPKVAISAKETVSIERVRGGGGVWKGGESSIQAGGQQDPLVGFRQKLQKEKGRLYRRKEGQLPIKEELFESLR